MVSTFGQIRSPNSASVFRTECGLKYGKPAASRALRKLRRIGAAFDQDVSVVFIDDGVFEIQKGQETAEIGMKNFSPTYRALEMYDVEKLYVSEESLAERGLTEDDILVDVEVLPDSRIADLMDEQDVIFTF